MYTADVPSDFKEQQEAIATELTQLRDKFKSGELEVDEYETQRDTLLGKRDDLQKAVIKAEISQEMRQQDAQQAWQSAIERTFDNAAKPDGGGIDYRTDGAKAADLDLFVRRLGEDPANADKDMDWFLTEGHRRVLALHGITKAAPPPPPPPPRQHRPHRASRLWVPCPQRWPRCLAATARAMWPASSPTWMPWRVRRWKMRWPACRPPSSRSTSAAADGFQPAHQHDRRRAAGRKPGAAGRACHR